MTAIAAPEITGPVTALPDEPMLEALAETFHRDGFAKISGLLGPEEIAALRADTGEMIAHGQRARETKSDFMYALNPLTGKEELHRIQYLFPYAQRNAPVVLLGHPFILAAVQHLLGEDFVCAAEALVFKAEGNGKEVPVHADCDPADPRLSPLIFNVDFYLDDATVENGCLYAAPGTHKLKLPIKEIQQQGFRFPGLIPVEAKAGDVLLHDIRVVHGSYATPGGPLRRTLYYEFQSLGAILTQNGPRPNYPVNSEWIRDRFRLQMRAIDARAAASYAQGEPRFPYHVPAGYEVPWPAPDETVNLRPALGYNAYI